MNNHRLLSSAVSLGSVLLLSACGGTTVNGKLINSPGDFSGCGETPETCNSDVLQGVVARIEEDADSGNLTIRFFQMSDNGDSTVTYSDGQKVFTFPEASNPATATNGTEIAYEWVMDYTAITAIIFPESNADYLSWALGFFGFQTDPNAVATSGEAYYSGEAIAATSSGLGGSGSSTLYADFEGSTAELIAVLNDGDISDFNVIYAPNMTIDGNTFTGNEVEFYDGLTPVDVTGANTSTASAGMFFGIVDENGYPAEYGAVLVSTGDNESVLLVAGGALDVGP